MILCFENGVIFRLPICTKGLFALCSLIKGIQLNVSFILTRVKKILEKLSRTRFLTEFEFRALFFGATQQGKNVRNSNHGRNRVLETYRKSQ